ncbi:MAG: hypothetical protein K2J77_11405, partial [Oscillospiraceae bacterium]|nr:hypothetical protein [Oscillospiraceae bacterium]
YYIVYHNFSPKATFLCGLCGILSTFHKKRVVSAGFMSVKPIASAAPEKPPGATNKGGTESPSPLIVP